VTQLHIFQHATETQQYAAGAVIFREGERSQAIYVVREGQVALWRQGLVVASAGPGKLTGLAFVSRLPHLVTAVAQTDCTLVAIDERQWAFLVQQTPHFATQVMALLIEQIHTLVTAQPDPARGVAPELDALGRQ
jgi:CRP/FNR family transcriptional regulator, cyclic AMP receptor protein